MYWDINKMKPEEFIKLQKEIDKMLEEGRQYQKRIRENARRK